MKTALACIEWVLVTLFQVSIMIILETVHKSEPSVLEIVSWTFNITVTIWTILKIIIINKKP